MSTDDEPDRGAVAFAERRWRDAYRDLAASTPGALTGAELERLATAAYLIGEEDASTAAWARAHQHHLDAGEVTRAARCAFWLGFQLAHRGDVAQAGGWFGRAQRLVDQAGECAEGGYLRVPAGLQAFAAGDPQAAHDHFSAAADIGRRFDDVDLVTLGRLGQGQALVVQGATEDGLRLLDEAMVAVVAEEVSATLAGIVYCAVIDACQLTFELRRAHEWTDALTRWCESQPDLVPYRGQCLVHRAQILQVHGAWGDALDEVRRACERLSQPDEQPALGAAYYQRAELHRLRGEFAAAADAYGQASRWGHDPQPGLALLRLAEGKVAAAEGAIRRVSAETRDRLARARVLAAAAEILVAAGDVAAASSAARELAEIAGDTGAPYLRAMSECALGHVRLAEGDPVAALGHLRQAADVWRALGARYDGARARVLVALAYRELGDDDTAAIELGTARHAFDELGARPDLVRVAALAPGAERDDHGLTPRELEVLQLVSSGSTNREIAAELVLSERTVERHLSNIFTKLGVSSRAGATAYAYRHQLV